MIFNFSSPMDRQIRVKKVEQDVTTLQNFFFNKKSNRKQLFPNHLIKILAYKKYYFKKEQKN